MNTKATLTLASNQRTAMLVHAVNLDGKTLASPVKLQPGESKDIEVAEGTSLVLSFASTAPASHQVVVPDKVKADETQVNNQTEAEKPNAKDEQGTQAATQERDAPRRAEPAKPVYKLRTRH